MEQFNKAKVVMLPTEGKTYIWLSKLSSTLRWLHSYIDDMKGAEGFHLYIISDDEIKEGDWVYTLDTKEIVKVNKVWFALSNKRVFNKVNKKVIATTDTSLEIVSKGINPVYEKLPQPSQQFIEEYIESYNKGEVITDILVEYEWFLNKQSCFKTVCYQQDMEARDSCMGMCEAQRPKINPDNTINIVKDKWNREEVIKAMIWAEENARYYTNSDKAGQLKQFNNWIDKNL